MSNVFETVHYQDLTVLSKNVNYLIHAHQAFMLMQNKPCKSSTRRFLQCSIATEQLPKLQFYSGIFDSKIHSINEAYCDF